MYILLIIFCRRHSRERTFRTCAAISQKKRKHNKESVSDKIHRLYNTCITFETWSFFLLFVRNKRHFKSEPRPKRVYCIHIPAYKLHSLPVSCTRAYYTFTILKYIKTILEEITRISNCFLSSPFP